MFVIKHERCLRPLTGTLYSMSFEGTLVGLLVKLIVELSTFFYFWTHVGKSFYLDVLYRLNLQPGKFERKEFLVGQRMG